MKNYLILVLSYYLETNIVYQKVYLCPGFTKGDHRRKSWEIHPIHIHGVDEPQSKYVIILLNFSFQGWINSLFFPYVEIFECH